MHPEVLKTTSINKVWDLIGSTPLVQMDSLLDSPHFNLFAKMEMLNLGGSMKDRPALNMIKKALEEGLIGKDTTIIESSSGNMGIGLAQACLRYGLPFICVVDARINPANARILRAYGAKLEIVKEPSQKNASLLEARLEKVQELLRTIPNSYWPNQYANKYNALAHEQTMQEIAKTLGGQVDYLFCSTGTCGTIRGCSDYIKKTNMNTKVYAVDAYGSVIFGGQPSNRLIPGHGAAVRPALYAPNMADKVVHITDAECVEGCKLLLKREAIFAGGSAGAVVTALRKCQAEIPEGANVVLILADRGERYLDSIYDENWVREKIGVSENKGEV